MWADQWVGASDDGVEDEVVSELLVDLSAAGTPTFGREYLYGVDDFRDWLRELNRAKPV